MGEALKLREEGGSVLVPLEGVELDPSGSDRQWSRGRSAAR